MVLLIDDDPRSLEYAERSLKVDGGFLFARTAEQAFFLLGNLAEDISAVLVNLNVPGQSGQALIVEIGDHYPKAPIIALPGALHENLFESAKALAVVDALAGQPRTGSRPDAA